MKPRIKRTVLLGMGALGWWLASACGDLSEEMQSELSAVRDFALVTNTRIISAHTTDNRLELTVLDSTVESMSVAEGEAAARKIAREARSRLPGAATVDTITVVLVDRSENEATGVSRSRKLVYSFGDPDAPND